MRTLSLAAAGVSLALTVAIIIRATGASHPYLAGAALVCDLVVVVSLLAGPRVAPGELVATAAPMAPEPSAVTASRSESALSGSSAAAVLTFLATLQERGRLVDFLEDNITTYSDTQVGAAARVVHAGCRAVLADYFEIVPVRPEDEGATVTVAPAFLAQEYRLVGNIRGKPPFTGKLMHRGWKTQSVKLPQVLLRADELPPIAPAEVELR